jgi:hypothetical protein
VKARAWQEFQHRALSSPDGPIPVERGDIVVVLVASSWSEAFAAMQGLLPDSKGKPLTDSLTNGIGPRGRDE